MNSGTNSRMKPAVKAAARCLARSRSLAHSLALTVGLAAVGVCPPPGYEPIINKQVVSSDIRIIGGQPYAPSAPLPERST